METVIQITVVCVLVAMLGLLLKKGSPELTLLLTLSAAVAAFLLLSGLLSQLLDFLQELSDAAGVSQDLFLPLYKTMGIAVVVKIGGGLCKDAGESALASVVETAGTVCALLVAIPLFRVVLSTLLELMNQ